MAQWDLSPTRDPITGLPRSFAEMPLEVHLELWDAGPKRLQSQSRHAALLVSMHGSRLYRRRNLDALPHAGADAIRAYLERQQRLQEQLLASLRADPVTGAGAAPELVARNSQLIWIWDWVSLALCLGWMPCTARKVPTADGPVDVELTPRVGSGATVEPWPFAAPARMIVEPWPFAAPAVTVRCEGRRLTARYGSDSELAEALAAARWETLEFELVAGEGGAEGTIADQA